MAPSPTIRIGTCGWSYPSGPGTWNGLFYPPRQARGFKAGNELAYYAEHFDTVEVNSTFYRPPERALTERWVQQTPAGFEFSVKLHQAFTHPMMHGRGGRAVGALHGAPPAPTSPIPAFSTGDLDAFRSGIDPIVVAGRLGMVLAQFPSAFHDGEEARAYLVSLLAALRGYPMAVELRHRSWSDHQADVQALLDEYGAAWVLIDEPKFASSIRQRPERVGSSVCYMRLHGRNAANWWTHDSPDDRYDYWYSERELDEFADALARVRGRVRKAYVYLNNHFAAKAVVNATVLKRQLGQPIRGEYRPELVARYPELRGIVPAAERDLLNG